MKLYEDYLVKSPQLIADIKELQGKTLACFCAPKRCHGEILLKYANLKTEECDNEIIP